MKHELIEYDDLGLVAFLVTQGFNLKQQKPHPNKPGLQLFVVSHDDRLGETVSRFYTNGGLVEPRRFLETIRSLKRGGGWL